MKNLENKIVWITGASSGIGLAVAKLFNERGSVVILSARKKETLEKTQKTLPNPEKSFVLPLDLTKPEQFVMATKQVIDRYNDIDVLVNNGGISQRSLASETPIDIDRAIMEVNYFGHVGLTKAVLPFMHTQKEAYIITISSLSGKFGFFQRSAYAASKHALQGFFESLRLEEEKNNIKVLLLLDIGGSMDDHIELCSQLFSAAKYEFKHLDFYYFHNCVYEVLWKKLMF